MTNITLDVSVIICTYTEERWRDLVAAIESVQKQRIPPCELIVVIDHNISLLKRVRQHLPDVIAIENHEPQGLSGARNSGIARARGAYIAFLDDDAVAEPDWLEQLNHVLEDPQILGAGGAVVPLWQGQYPAWLPEEFYWVVGCSYRGLPERVTTVRNLYGGCACYKREVFEIVGAFRNSIGRVGTALPMGCEETELCIRARQRWPQRNFLYVPHARIHHRILPGRAQWSYFRSRCYAEGLSKAGVVKYVGASDGLASERTYALRVLPLGIVRCFVDSLFHQDLMGFARTGAIIAGLAMTMTGYGVGRVGFQLAKIKNMVASVQVPRNHYKMPLSSQAQSQEIEEV